MLNFTHSIETKYRNSICRIMPFVRLRVINPTKTDLHMLQTRHCVMGILSVMDGKTNAMHSVLERPGLLFRSIAGKISAVCLVRGSVMANGTVPIWIPVTEIKLTRKS